MSLGLSVAAQVLVAAEGQKNAGLLRRRQLTKDGRAVSQLPSLQLLLATLLLLLLLLAAELLVLLLVLLWQRLLRLRKWR